MAIVKEITINLNDDDAKKGLSDINKLFKEVDQSEQKAVESTMSLRAELKKLQTDLQSGKLTGAAFDEGIKKAGLMKDQINDVNNRIKALATDAADVALRGIGDFATGAVGAFSAVQGGMALFGDESEDVQKALMKLQGAMALLNGVTAINNALQADSAGMMALQSAKTTLLTGAQTLYTTVLGTSTGALKAFRIALVSTGIGAIVVGLGLLVANFESISKWVTTTIEKFGGWRKVLLMVSPPIYAIIKALEMMGVIDDEQTSKAKRNAEERIKANQKEIKELDKKKKATNDYYDFEIRKAQAAGKSTEDLEKKKRNDALKTAREQNEKDKEALKAGQEKSAEWIKQWNERQAEIKKIQQDGLIAEIESATKASEKLNEIQTKESEKRQSLQQKEAENRAKENREKLNEDLKNAKDNFELQRKLVNDNAKLSKDDRNQLLKQINQEEADAIVNHKKSLQDIENKYITDIENLNANTDQKKLDLQKSRDLKEIEQLVKTEEEKQMLLIQFNEKYRILQNELDEKNQIEADAKKAEKLLNEANNPELNIDARIEAVRLREEAINSIIFASEDARTAYQKANSDARTKIAEAEQNAKMNTLNVMASTLNKAGELLGKETAAGKAMAVASATISTYQSAVSAYEAGVSVGGPAGLVLGPVSAALAVAAGLKNIKSILSVKVPNGGGGGGGVPNISTPTTGGAPSATPIFNTIGASPVNQLTRALGEQPPVQAFVVGSQVTSQQSLDRNIIQNASLGG
jgi:hypothetical protein